MKSSILILLCAQLFSLLVGFISLKRKSISVSGFVALLAISSLFIWCDQIALLFVLFLMFASSSILTHFKKSSKIEFEEVVAKTGPRDYIQALANLGVSVIALLLYLITGSDLFIAALAGSVSAANADSWASEIGGLSKKQPVMITTFKPIPKGLSGGVTLVGTLGGVAGSFFTSASTIVLLFLISPFPGNNSVLFWATFLAGIIGFILDSYLGAILQVLYLNHDKEKSTENPEGNISHIKGIKWMNNDMVNFITTLGGGLLGALFYYLLLQIF